MIRTIRGIDLPVSTLGMGCWAIGGPFQFLQIQAGWGEVDDNESIRAVQTALESGINFFDTAANYGTGHSEHILGRALAGKRDQVVIATKFGFKIDQTAKRVAHYDRPEDLIQNVRVECEGSLRRLNTDYIDLYQLHVWDYPLDHALAVRDELEKLVQAGKIRTYGWSTDSVEAAQVFAQGKHCVAIQHDLNVMMDAPQMLEVCHQLDLASVNRSPLARGALTGKYTKDSTFAANDVRRDEWSYQTFFEPTLDRLEALREILTSNGRTLAQGALAWIWARSERTFPIPGIRTVAQAKENAKAMELGALTPQQMAQIETILNRSTVNV